MSELDGARIVQINGSWLGGRNPIYEATSITIEARDGTRWQLHSHEVHGSETIWIWREEGA